MENIGGTVDQAWEMDGFRRHVQHWKSDVRFMGEEIHFIRELLNSDIFDPVTLNLFEKLQDYLGRSEEFNLRNTRLVQLVSEYGDRMASRMETKDHVLRGDYLREHGEVEREVLKHMDDFRELKMEVFNYVTGNLKKRK